jgi:regulatory protein
MEKSERVKSPIFLKTAMYCSLAERCKSEVMERVKKVINSSDEIDEIITILEEEGYINELRYATSYVRDKFRFNKWGKIKIAYMLQCKKIPSAIISEALAEIDDEAYVETVSALIRAKTNSIKSTNPSDKIAKLYRFAASRGFESDVIRKALIQSKVDSRK